VDLGQKNGFGTLIQMQGVTFNTDSVSSDLGPIPFNSYSKIYILDTWDLKSNNFSLPNELKQLFESETPVKIMYDGKMDFIDLSSQGIHLNALYDINICMKLDKNDCTYTKGMKKL